MELWALSQPYSGGGFDGVALAGTQIGELSGQHFLPCASHELDFREPGAGIRYLTLMLREWEGAGFVTRDHVSFARSYVVEKPLVPKASGKESRAGARVSINDAEHAEIAAIKGMTRKLADAIVRARPFRSVDALVEVKGMGPELLEEVRQFIQL